MIYLLTVKEINSFKEHTFIHKKYNNSRQIYLFVELYSFQGNIFIQGKHIQSGKLYAFKEIYSFKEQFYIRSSSRPYVHSRKLYSFNNVAFADLAEIYI